MKLVSYHEAETLRPGVLVEDTVVDLGELMRREKPVDAVCGCSVRELVASAGPDEFRILDEAARGVVAEWGRPLAEITLGPPVPDPQKVLGVAFNYDGNIAEAKAAGLPLGTGHPVVFAKLPSSLVGTGGPIALPRASPDEVDWEGELAVVIGRACRRATQVTALDHIAGYTILNDVSARDLQMATGQWLPGKAFDSSAPCGPALVTVDEIPDPHDLELTTEVNGDTVQSANTGQMIHSIARLIAIISAAVTLMPGDIIGTGTPAGVGAARTPPRFLRDGDTVSVAISGLGELTNPVRAQL